MAKVLTAISLDSPSSSVSAGVNDTFSFAGTPSFAGGGGVQRYDFRWEVDEGSGFVPITGSTGLTTADTNPLVNSNSQTQNSITVTCAEEGSYTIRMAGAPTSGGSYSVFSSTQTAEVTLAGITGTFAATETGTDTASASGTVAISGTAAAAESGADVFAGSGSLESDDITGMMAAAESGPDEFAGAGAVPVAGAMGSNEAGADAVSASGAVSISGALAANDNGTEVFSGAGLVLIAGGLAATETGSDSFFSGSNNGTHRATGALRLGLRRGL